MKIVEEAIALVSPSWAASRAASRLQYEQLATFSDATPGSLGTPSLAPGVSPDWALELGRDRRLMADRVKQLERDNILARAILSRSQEAVVGTGFRYQPLTDDPKWNAKAKRLWDEWAEAKNCDDRKLLSLHKIVSLSHRGKLRDGESGIVKLRSGRIRGFESEELGSPEGYYRPGMVDGIELDESGRPKIFNIFKLNQKTLYSDRRVSGERLSVPVDDVIFVAFRDRLGQTRGITRFDGSFWAFDQAKGSIEAITVGLRMSACLGIILKKTSPVSGVLLPDQDSPNGQRRSLAFKPGGVLQLNPGEEAEQITPTQTTSGVQEHINMLMRMASSEFGVPIEVTFLNFGPLNLSSARANLQAAVRTWRGHQHDVAEEIYSPLNDWKLSGWMADGELEERDDWRRRRWIKPGWMILDPLAEAQADIALLDAGLETLAEVAGRRGRSVEELIEELKEERKLLKAAGLEIAASTLTRDRGANMAPGAPGKPPGKKNDEDNRAQNIRSVRAAVAKRLQGASLNRIG